MTPISYHVSTQSYNKENISPTSFVVKTVTVWIPLLGYNANSTAVFGSSVMVTAKNLIDCTLSLINNAYYNESQFH